MLYHSAMKSLTEEELAKALPEAAGWELRDGVIEREWIFPDFVSALGFVQEIGGLAEQAQHHPDIDIRYNRVRLALVTHDAGGITALDMALARTISERFAGEGAPA